MVFNVFSGFTQEQKNVLLLDNWMDETIEKGAEDAVFNDVWGFSQNGQDYCVIGSNKGTHFFKIENDQLVLIDFKPGKHQGNQTEHRDFKVYKNHLYGVCDEGQSSLQIFDLSYLPDSASKVYDDDAFFQICHNIFIDTLNAKLYACGANNLGMQILDISDPVNPELNYHFNELPYVHDCYVRNDTAFLNCGFSGLQIYDFSSPSPSQLGILDFYPNQGYNHSGWLSPSGDRYVFIDETKGSRIRQCTWNQLNDISITQTFAVSGYQDYVPHNIILLENLAFVSYYNKGLRIFDMSQAPFEEIGVYDTFNKNTKYKLNGAWGVFVMEDKNQILVSDRQNGLFLFSFPIDVLNTKNKGTFVTSTPFIDEHSVLIPRKVLDSDGLQFTITGIDGRVFYEQENYLNYVHIPLSLPAGIFVYTIYNEFNDFVESGTFVKAN